MKKLLTDYYNHECNVNVIRLNNVYPDIHMPFKLAYFQVEKGEETTIHNHAEREIFICLSGTGKIQINEDVFDIYKDIAWFVEQNKHHKIINDGNIPMNLISIWWFDNQNNVNA